MQKHNKGEKYFEDLVKVVGNQISEARMPKVLVISNDIFRIPRPTVDALDNVAISARMNTLEDRTECRYKNIKNL